MPCLFMMNVSSATMQCVYDYARFQTHAGHSAGMAVPVSSTPNWHLVHSSFALSGSAKMQAFFIEDNQMYVYESNKLWKGGERQTVFWDFKSKHCALAVSNEN